MKRLPGRFQEWRPEAVGENLGHYYKSSLQYAAMSARSRVVQSSLGSEIPRDKELPATHLVGEPVCSQGNRLESHHR